MLMILLIACILFLHMQTQHTHTTPHHTHTYHTHTTHTHTHTHNTHMHTRAHPQLSCVLRDGWWGECRGKHLGGSLLRWVLQTGQPGWHHRRKQVHNKYKHQVSTHYGVCGQPHVALLPSIVQSSNLLHGGEKLALYWTPTFLYHPPPLLHPTHTFTTYIHVHASIVHTHTQTCTHTCPVV